MNTTIIVTFILIVSAIDFMIQKRKKHQYVICLLLITAAVALLIYVQSFEDRLSSSKLLINLIDNMGGLGF